MNDQRRTSRTRFARLCSAAALGLPLAVGCVSSPDIGFPRSATQQNLATEAIDRALAQLE